MDVLIDGAPFAVTLSPTDTIRHAIAAARPSISAGRRIVMSVLLDGQDGASLDDACSAHQKLEITTGDGPKLCLGVLDNLEPFLDQLGRLHETTAELLHQGKMSEFTQALMALLQGWTLVITGVRNLGAVMGGLPGTENLPLEDMRARVTELTQAVAGVKTTFERQDPSRLADVLEYDLAERLPYWKGVLATLRGALSRTA